MSNVQPPTRRVLIALGSNTRQSAHILWASQRLSVLLSEVRLSRCCWTSDIKGTGIMYMNRLATGHTTLTAEALIYELKRMEAETGRTRNGITIDLDLMQYGEQRFHEKDWPRPYIQQLLPDVL